MKRPTVKEFTKHNDIMIGDYNQACQKYDSYLQLEKGARKLNLYPEILRYVDGSGLSKKTEFVTAVEKHLDELERTIQKPSKADRIAKLKEQIKLIEAEHEGNWVITKISPNGGSGQKEETIAISENKDWLVNYCEQNFSYSPTFETVRPESDKQYLSPWYRIEEVPVVIVLQDKII